jgi:hypothetical protein
MYDLNDTAAIENFRPSSWDNMLAQFFGTAPVLPVGKVSVTHPSPFDSKMESIDDLLIAVFG